MKFFTKFHGPLNMENDSASGAFMYFRHDTFLFSLKSTLTSIQQIISNLYLRKNLLLLSITVYCEPGKFENTTSNRCEVCPVKTYKSVVGNTDCIDCIASKTTPDTGTTSADGCSLGEWYFVHFNGNPLYMCVFKHLDWQNVVQFNEIMSNRYFNWVIIKYFLFYLEYCRPGYKRTTPTNCEKCAVGKYQPMYGMTTCLSCDPGYTTASTGTVDQTDCYRKFISTIT